MRAVLALLVALALIAVPMGTPMASMASADMAAGMCDCGGTGPTGHAPSACQSACAGTVSVILTGAVVPLSMDNPAFPLRPGRQVTGQGSPPETRPPNTHGSI